MPGERISKILDKIPTGPLGFAGNGRVAGMVGDLIRDATEAYVPTAPTDVEIAYSEPADGGTRYYVNVTGLVRKVSEVRAVLEAIPGKINLATDKVEIENVEVLRDRTFRKTFQFQVVVRD